MSVFLFISRQARDAICERIGNRRYRLFGKGDTCWLPAPALPEPFLD